MPIQEAAARSVPDYAELPILEGLGLPHAWDVLDPSLGSLSFIGAAERISGAAEVQLGEAYALNLPLDFLEPPLFGRSRVGHKVIEVGRNTLEDVIDEFNPQSGSQWDGLRHVRAREHGFFGGVTDDDVAVAQLGIQNWARQGITGRGVLLDVDRYLGENGRPSSPFAGGELTVADLIGCARRQGSELRPGDVLCIRTGWLAGYRSLDARRRRDQDISTRFVGLRADAEMAEFVWDNRLGALAADNPALECAPGDPQVGSLHRRLIPLLGTAIAELLDLDLLAHRCAEIGRWTFQFTAVPLPLHGGVSSPSNALAVL
jgi:hypothetical protein